jgi:Na+/proline symporter
MPPLDFTWVNVLLIAFGAIPVLVVFMMRRRLLRKSNKFVTAIGWALFLLACLGLFITMVGLYQEGRRLDGESVAPAIIGWFVEAAIVGILLTGRSRV